jgi:hypothetical protein
MARDTTGPLLCVDRRHSSQESPHGPTSRKAETAALVAAILERWTQTNVSLATIAKAVGCSRKYVD